MEYDIRTKCIRGGDGAGEAEPTGAIGFPIYQTASFAHPGVGRSTGYDYTREKNPSRERLEETMAALEGAAEAFALSSGMAALTAVFELFSPGDHIVSSEDLYGGTLRLFRTVGAKNGLAFDLTDTRDLGGVEALINARTRAVYIETPSNPMMHITDLRAVSALAKARGLLLIVDNTFLSPYFQNPIALGADIVVHSATKYLGGHNDTVAGIICCADTALAERLRLICKTTGAGLSPFDSWLILRGVKTLAVRMERQQENAAEIAAWLKGHPRVRAVYYPGFPDHPGHAVNKAQSRGAGAMLSFAADSGETARRVLEKVRLILFAESLGGVETLITYPILQTHAFVPEAERERLGITASLLRLSVGIEYVKDLIADLAQALEE